MLDFYSSRIGSKQSLSVVERDRRGYSPQADEFCRNGYFVVRNAFDSDRIDYVKNVIRWPHVIHETDGSGIRSALAVHRDPALAGAFLESLGMLAQDILGSEVYVHQSRINFKRPGASGWTWHSDFETWHTQDGMPDMRAVTAMIALDDNSSENGPLLVIPGSHHLYWADKKPNVVVSPEEHFADQKTGVPSSEWVEEIKRACGRDEEEVLLRSGDLLIFDCNLMHSSGPNHSGHWRRNLFFVLNSVENQLVNAFSYPFNRPEEMGAREIGRGV